MSVIARMTYELCETMSAARASARAVSMEASRELCVSLCVRMLMPCAKMAMGDRTIIDRSSEHASTAAQGA